MDLIWEFVYIDFCPNLPMLRLDYTNKNIDEIYKKLDFHFETMDSVINNALEVIEKYENQIESFKITQ